LGVAGDLGGYTLYMIFQPFFGFGRFSYTSQSLMFSFDT